MGGLDFSPCVYYINHHIVPPPSRDNSNEYSVRQDSIVSSGLGRCVYLEYVLFDKGWMLV